MNEELDDYINGILGIQEEKTFIPNPPGVHFSEYRVQFENDPRIKAYAKKLNPPTDEERHAYMLHQEAERIRIDKEIEEDRKRGPAFLSDEWRWARIDAQVESCRDYIRKYG